MMHFSEIGTLSDRLRNGEVSPIEVSAHLLERIDRLDPVLHSYVDIDKGEVLSAAAKAEEEIQAGRWLGPLHGVPIAVKDLFSTGAAPTEFGSAHLSNNRLDKQAEVVGRLRDAGAIIVGRLRMSEAALTDHGPGLPTPINPWDADTWVGTSSSGCASATAAGLCYGSLGSDTGGSVRGPATAAGLSGLKPTRGAIPSDGALPLSRTLDTVAPFARSARDCRLIFDAIANVHLVNNDGPWDAATLRIGVDSQLLDSVSPEISAMMRRTAEVFAGLGAEIIDVTVPDGADLASQWVNYVGFEAIEPLGPLYPADKKDLYGPEIAYVLEQGRLQTQEQYDQIREDALIFSRQLDEVLSTVNALLLPTIGVASPTNEEIYALRLDYATWNRQVMRLTCPYNFSGHPAMTFPTGFTPRGTPLGAQLVGKHNAEHLLLSLAEQFQDVTTHHSIRPPQFA